MTKEVEFIIEQLDFKAHPEGGFFKETYRSNGKISARDISSGINDPRNFSTCIYFLLTSENFSAFHRIKQDEIWHFYKDSPIKLHIIASNGNYHQYTVGNDLAHDQHPQLVVNAQDWFAAEVVDNDSYSLVGCTVSPGFDFQDFELPVRSDLCEKFPEHAVLITKFTRH